MAATATRPTSQSRQTLRVTKEPVPVSIKGGQYRFGEKIGKGAYGIVYKAMNTEHGTFVAIKRVGTKNLPHDEIQAIEDEVNLLKELVHENIVRYIDSVREDGYLNIVLEFVENGSLVSVLKGWGTLPENVVALYTSQVLAGLAFLHKEGVIHRDIKGANILMTSNGVAKLADFGVAIRADNAAELDVAGSAYWMAPEIIEMRGQQTPACDIWSVGCTVIELVTGKPPYFDLNPLPALFRIVQDEHPPFPIGVTDNLQNFLTECFHKDPALRSDAEALQAHPWLRSVKQAPGDLGIQDGERHQMQQMLNDPEKFTVEDLAEKMNSIKSVKSMKSVHKSVKIQDPASMEGRFSESGDSSDWGDSSSSEDEIEEKRDLPRPQSMKKDITQFADDDDDMDDFASGSEDGDLDLDMLNNSAIEAVAIDDDNWDDEDSGSDGNAAQVDHLIESQMLRGILAELDAHMMKEDLDVSGVTQTFDKLNKMFTDNPESINEVMRTAVIPIMEMLQQKVERNDEITLLVMDVIDRILGHAEHGQKFLQALCLVGLIPSVGEMVKPNCNPEIRDKASLLLRKFCSKEKENEFVRSMFIASGGMSILVQAIRNDYTPPNKETIFSAIDCIRMCFQNAMHPKRDICRLFTKAGLLRPLVKLLHRTLNDAQNADEAIAYGEHMAEIFHTFGRQNDPVIRAALRKHNILHALLATLPSLENDSSRKKILLQVLRLLRELSQDPTSIEALIENHTVASIVPFLKSSEQEVITQVAFTLFQMVRVQPARSCEEAATHGAIPVLQELIRHDHPSRYVLIPTISKFAYKATPMTLYELKKHNGVEFYLEMTKSEMSYCQTDALVALADWVADKPSLPRVELIMCQAHHVTQLIKVFTGHDMREFHRILAPFRVITKASRRVSDAFGTSELFLQALGKWLREPLAPTVRLDLLKMTSELFNNLSTKNRFVNTILPVVDQCAHSENSQRLVIKQCSNLIGSFMTYADRQTWKKLNPETQRKYGMTFEAEPAASQSRQYSDGANEMDEWVGPGIAATE